MKIRQSFVANSSSSSFIIGIRDNLPDVEQQNLPVWAKKMLTRVMNLFKGEKKLKTKEEFDKYIMGEYGYGDYTLEELLAEETYLQRWYDKAIKAIESGFSVIYMRVDNDDQWLANFLEDLPEDGTDEGIILIHGDN